MASDKDIAITPDFNNSALTFGPTFSTLLKLNLFPKIYQDLPLFLQLYFSVIFVFKFY